jgi:hypothetical protein
MAKWRPSLVVAYGIPVEQFISGIATTATTATASRPGPVERNLVLESDG